MKSNDPVKHFRAKAYQSAMRKLSDKPIYCVEDFQLNDGSYIAGSRIVQRMAKIISSKKDLPEVRKYMREHGSFSEYQRYRAIASLDEANLRYRNASRSVSTEQMSA